MLRYLLPLLSSLQIGLRIKQSVQIYLRQAVVVAVAVVLLALALFFGLLALYHALASVYGFTPLEAAGMVGGGLAALGLFTLATLPLFARRPKSDVSRAIAKPGEGLGMIEQGLGSAMRQTSPLTLLAVAFVAGLFAGRR